MDEELKLKMELMQKTLQNTFKLLSAIFDMNNGEIVIPREILDKAEISFYVTEEDLAFEGQNSILMTKKNGPSPLYESLKNKPLN